MFELDEKEIEFSSIKNLRSRVTSLSSNEKAEKVNPKKIKKSPEKKRIKKSLIKDLDKKDADYTPPLEKFEQLSKK